jgi:hypothetical protein
MNLSPDYTRIAVTRPPGSRILNQAILKTAQDITRRIQQYFQTHARKLPFSPSRLFKKDPHLLNVNDKATLIWQGLLHAPDVSTHVTVYFDPTAWTDAEASGWAAPMTEDASNTPDNQSVIYIKASEWSLTQDGAKELYETVLHELVHVTDPQKTNLDVKKYPRSDYYNHPREQVAFRTMRVRWLQSLKDSGLTHAQILDQIRKLKPSNPYEKYLNKTGKFIEQPPTWLGRRAIKRSVLRKKYRKTTSRETTTRKKR